MPHSVYRHINVYSSDCTKASYPSFDAIRVCFTNYTSISACTYIHIRRRIGLGFGGPPRLDLRLFDSSACQKHQCALASPARFVLSLSYSSLWTASSLCLPPPPYLALSLVLSACLSSLLRFFSNRIYIPMVSAVREYR